jgi:molybdopterin molybdotransferase
MLSVADTLSRTLALMSPVGYEVIALTAARGRVLARDVVARRTQPPFPASAMDGYAVRDIEAMPGAGFAVVGEAAAGVPFAGVVQPGQCVRIFTGGVVPEGLDRIIIQEDVTRDGGRITLSDTLDAQKYVRRAGLDFTDSDTLLSAPRRLSPEDIALIAAAGVPFVTVHRRPRVALLATGDELVLPGEAAPPGSIVSSNNFGLAALIEGLGAEAEILPIAADTVESLRELATTGAQADLFVTLGGASVGDHDLIRPALADAGLDLDLYKIAMRPGKPFMAGRLGGTPMLGLPGNPVSAMVCGRLFVAPAVEALSGLPPSPAERHRAVLGTPLGKNGPREHYMRARVERVDGMLVCTPFDSQDSSRLAILSEANALAIRPVSAPAAEAGEAIDVLMLR